ncbi:MAG: peptide ABC transporter substrate-binding protein [Phycisphaerales bacterium]|nr:peptide ABC transporter substrate-binding protein [Phycisphaerales bacterium]
MTRLLVPLLLLAAALCAIVLADRPMPRADLTLNNGQDPTTLDPSQVSWTSDLRVSRLLFEGLVANDVFDPGYGIAPAAAERWEISADGREYRFFLREEARWSNGEPVRAGDFVYAWRRAILPDTAADYFTFFEYIEGVGAFFDWRLGALDAFARDSAEMAPATRAQAARDLWAETERRFGAGVGLEVVSDRELVVRLTHPVPFFLDLCAFPAFFPVYEPLVGQYDRLDPDTGRVISGAGWTKPPRLVSNGPFALTVWRFKRDMRFEVNPWYWDRDSLDVRTIEITSIADPSAQVLAYQTGAVDYLVDVNAPYRREMVAQKNAYYREHQAEHQRLVGEGWDAFEIDRRLPPDPRGLVHITPAFGTYLWNFNCSPAMPDGRPNPLADARVRRALALMIDKRAIAEQVRGLGEPVARTIVPPGSLAGYDSPEGLPCLSDCRTETEREALIGRARALLAEAGYPDPAGLPTIELEFNKDSGHDLAAQSIAKNWQETLGIPTRLVQKELTVFRDDLKTHNFITSRASWYGDYPDPLTFLEINRTGDGNNDRAFSNPAFDSMLDASYIQTDPAERLAGLARAERLLVEEELPFVPLVHYVNVSMFDAARLSGPNPHPRSIQDLSLFDILGDGIGSDEVKRVAREEHR